MKQINIIITLFFLLLSCLEKEQTLEEVKKQSLNDVYFYLSNYNIVNNIKQIKLYSLNKIEKKCYQIKYIINNDNNSWIINYYNEDDFSYNFFYKDSENIRKITDSINEIRLKINYYPLSKRWDCISQVN